MIQRDEETLQGLNLFKYHSRGLWKRCHCSESDAIAVQAMLCIRRLFQLEHLAMEEQMGAGLDPSDIQWRGKNVTMDQNLELACPHFHLLHNALATQARIEPAGLQTGNTEDPALDCLIGDLGASNHTAPGHDLPYLENLMTDEA